MRPYEKSDIADIHNDWRIPAGFFKGYHGRKPVNQTGMPCILLIPGYGCGSIENYASGYNGKLINEWLKAGYAVVTIEKSGMGDSYDLLCHAVKPTLATDIESLMLSLRIHGTTSVC